MKTVYEVQVSFTQSTVGEVIDEATPEEVEKRLYDSNSGVPNFTVDYVKTIGPYEQLYLFETNLVN